ncbi:Auxin-responsive protein SAUR32 [Ananas comosus]|uniref:Auxin-responsive protein SAUR32 n=1 Tax=Ananas comosus TaxID=4615 RepID=A0A199VBT3_ANACO|nr:Auxin-responsive protein SAUR32 [Ananas comosus]
MQRKRSFRLCLLWARKPREGCIAVRVGAEGERPKRFDVPEVRLHHVLFMRLFDSTQLRFDYDGTMVIPCRVDSFRDMLQKIVDSDKDAVSENHRRKQSHRRNCHVSHFAQWFRA